MTCPSKYPILLYPSTLMKNKSKTGQGLYAQTGNLRCYKFPLSGEYLDFPGTSDRITRLRLSSDDQFIFITGQDGTLIIFQMNPRDVIQPLNASSSSESSESLQPNNVLLSSDFTQEVLVTKYDLEEKQSQMSELKNKVDELTLHNQYQMRLKDMNYKQLNQD